jgi:hypothetical protein
MRAILILLLAVGAIMLPSAQASAPITYGPGYRQHAVNVSLGVPQPLAVSQARFPAIPRPLDPATQGGSDPTCAAGVGCETQITFTVRPRKMHLVPAVPVTG